MSLSILRQGLIPAFSRLEIRALSTAAPLFKDAVSEPKKRGPKPGSTRATATTPKATKATKTTKATKATKAAKAIKAEVKPKGRIGRPPKELTEAELEAKAKLDAVRSQRERKAALSQEDTPPKRSPSAYMLFFKEYYDENKASLPNSEGKLTIPDIARKVSQAWSDLNTQDPAKVETYQAKAKQLSAAFDQQYKDWYFARTSGQRLEIEKALGKKLTFPGGKGDFKKELRNRPGNPGRPSSSFFEYLRYLTPELSDHPEVADKTGMERHQNIARLAAERWRALPDTEKDHWRKEFKQRKAKFDEWFATQQESGPQA